MGAKTTGAEISSPPAFLHFDGRKRKGAVGWVFFEMGYGEEL